MKTFADYLVMMRAVSPSITIIIVPAEDHDAFEQLALDARRSSSMGWETFATRG